MATTNNNTILTPTLTNTSTISIASITTSDANAAETLAGESSNPGRFIIKRNGDVSAAATQTYTLSGNAQRGVDYQEVTGSINFAAGEDTAYVNIDPIDDRLYEFVENVTLSIGDKSATVKIFDNDPLPQLVQPVKNLLSIEGNTATTYLSFSKVAQKGDNRSEVAAFVVDDDLGSINGVKPGESGYLAAALDRAKTIFSSLGNSNFDKQWDGDSERIFKFNPGERVQLLAIDNDTLYGVKNTLAAGKIPTNVSFSIPTNGATPFSFVTATDNGFDINFNNTTINVKPVFDFSNVGLIQKGTALQGKIEGEVLDLRTAGIAFAEYKTTGDSTYNNYIAFYQVIDDRGTLANGLKPSDDGYAEAAIQLAISSIDRPIEQIFKNQSDTTILPTGRILAPVVVANGTFDDFLKQNPNNEANGKVQAYFNYIGANTDKVDHFRLLGDNKFGVEDVYGGGDRDYNDMIIQLKVS